MHTTSGFVQKSIRQRLPQGDAARPRICAESKTRQHGKAAYVNVGAGVVPTPAAAARREGADFESRPSPLSINERFAGEYFVKAVGMRREIGARGPQGKMGIFQRYQGALDLEADRASICKEAKAFAIYKVRAFLERFGVTP
jgi:hypothetical protein